MEREQGEGEGGEDRDTERDIQYSLWVLSSLPTPSLLLLHPSLPPSSLPSPVSLLKRMEKVFSIYQLSGDIKLATQHQN